MRKSNDDESKGCGSAKLDRHQTKAKLSRREGTPERERGEAGNAAADGWRCREDCDGRTLEELDARRRAAGQTRTQRSGAGVELDGRGAGVERQLMELRLKGCADQMLEQMVWLRRHVLRQSRRQ
jgi:hypothetical protein